MFDIFKIFVIVFVIVIINSKLLVCEHRADNASSADVMLMVDSDVGMVEEFAAAVSAPHEKFIVSIAYKDDEDVPMHFCAGNIIKPNVVISAAHCFAEENFPEPLSHENVIIMAGNPSRLNRTTDTVLNKVSLIIVHHGFKKDKIRMDIALLKLTDKFDLTVGNIDKATLPYISPNDKAKCLIFGWGRFYLNGPVPSELVSADISLMPLEQCKKIYQNFDVSQLCGKDSTNKGKKNVPQSCVGDSGAPLVCEGILTGIVSYGLDCSDDPIGVFTNVYAFKDWIARNAGEIFSNNYIHLFILFYMLINM